MTADNQSASDRTCRLSIDLPFYSPDKSLRRIANQWNHEYDVALIQYGSEEAFMQQVQLLQPPVVALGAAGKLLESKFIARLAALKTRPIIVALVETPDESTMEACYQQGTDRVIATPFCSARIFQALISALHSQEHYYPPYRFKTGTHTCDIGDQVIRLTTKHFGIAQYLFLNQGKLIPKYKILKDIWGLEEEECVTRRLEVHMSHVRRQLSLDGSLGWEIRSRRKLGYGIFQSSSNNRGPHLLHRSTVIHS